MEPQPTLIREIEDIYDQTHRFLSSMLYLMSSESISSRHVSPPSKRSNQPVVPMFHKNMASNCKTQDSASHSTSSSKRHNASLVTACLNVLWSTRSALLEMCSSPRTCLKVGLLEYSAAIRYTHHLQEAHNLRTRHCNAPLECQPSALLAAVEEVATCMLSVHFEDFSTSCTPWKLYLGHVPHQAKQRTGMCRRHRRSSYTTKKCDIENVSH